MTETTDLTALATRVLETLRAKGAMVATAESCTGGMVAVALTDIAGSSDVVERGFVTYSNDAKAELLSLPMPLIETHGAVSKPVALAMAEGAFGASHAQIAVSVTGIAGPGGGSAEKPVGTVHFGVVIAGHTPTHSHQVFAGDRAAVRLEATRHALNLLLDAAAALSDER
ncbi:MAG: CinA family protein [Devosiaceae bacterium]|nr:CinA family protein [Devosiaceae bacterium MH13]